MAHWPAPGRCLPGRRWTRGGRERLPSGSRRHGGGGGSVPLAVYVSVGRCHTRRHVGGERRKRLCRLCRRSNCRSWVFQREDRETAPATQSTQTPRASLRATRDMGHLRESVSSGRPSCRASVCRRGEARGCPHFDSGSRSVGDLVWGRYDRRGSRGRPLGRRGAPPRRCRSRGVDSRARPRRHRDGIGRRAPAAQSA